MRKSLPWLVALALSAAILPALAAKGPKQPLGIANTAFQQYEDGPRMPSDMGYGAGELAFFTFEIAGYQKSEKDHIQLVWDWKCLDPSGIPLVEPVSGKVDTEVSPEDKDWLPRVRQNFEIPSYAPSGVYHLLIFVKDELASAATNVDLQFRVRGHNTGPTDKLAVRSFSVSTAPRTIRSPWRPQPTGLARMCGRVSTSWVSSSERATPSTSAMD